MQVKGVKLKKSLLFVFQAAEEGGGGAKYVVADEFYKSKKIEAFYAMHVWPALNPGEFGTKIGIFTKQNINLDITITGKGCHASAPQNGIDSILIGSKLIEAYQSISSRNMNPNDFFVLTIGAFHSGTVRNIIPETANMLGTIRINDINLIPKIQERMESINKGFEIAFGVKIDMKFVPFYLLLSMMLNYLKNHWLL